jgi:glycosyltransferase involved in cell wall biosynthesis
MMEPVPERLPFTFHTHTGSPTGYSETATLIFRALVEEGTEVHYLCKHDDVIYEPKSYDLLVNELRNIEPEDEPIQVVYSIAPLFQHNSGKYRIGWSMIEVDRICDRWVRACNKMDEVWVPTQMNKEAFVASGVGVPVKVVPLGIDTKQFKPSFLPAVYHGDHKFRFFASGFWQLRKRWDLLLIAFAEEFCNEKEVGLVIKTQTQQGPDEVVDQIHSWVGHRVDDQVAVVEGGYPWWEYVMMMRSCHAFVLPTSGEGYGCPPVQALACGLPVLVTDCQGPGEVLRREDGEPFSGVRFFGAEMERTSVQHEYYEGGNWWVPKVEDIRAAMREVYEGYEGWRAAALEGAGQVHELRSGAVAARAVRENLARIYREEL